MLENFASIRRLFAVVKVEVIKAAKLAPETAKVKVAENIRALSRERISLVFNTNGLSRHHYCLM